MKKLLLIIGVLLFSNAIVAQNLNEYKYAIVPYKFGFLKEKNEYQLNTITKLFMEKYGFETYFDSDTAVPSEFTNSNCNKVYVNVEKQSTLFVTKLIVVLKDCNGKVLHTSKQGTSREKEFRVSYNDALRAAFLSFVNLNHTYDEKKASLKPIVEEPKKTIAATNSNSEQLFAQPIQNGFQLVNSEQKEVMKLYKTSVKDVYTAIKGNLQGVFVSKNNEWFFEYYQNDNLASEKVDVKF